MRLMEVCKLIYFNVRGVAEPIRLTLALANVPFQDIRIPLTQLNHNTSLPILEHDGQSISNPCKILHYLSHKLNLHGADEQEGAQVDEILNLIHKYEESIQSIYTAKNEFEKMRAQEHVRDVSTPQCMGTLSDILERNGTGFFVGQSVSVADVYTLHLIMNDKILWGYKIREKYPVLRTHAKSMGAIPALRTWIQTRPDTIF